MKKLCKALALVLCMTMLLSTFTVAADSVSDNILTLDEAKQIALDNDVQYKLQQSYIQQKAEDYDDVYKIYSRNPGGNYNSVVERAKAEIAYKMKVESAASAVRKEVFTRNDLKRKSNYEVTVAYYDVMKANYKLEDLKRAVDLARRNLEIAKIKVEQGMMTKIELAQTENAYTSSQTEYNSGFSELQNYFAALSKVIGKTLDVYNVKIDMTIAIPDVASLDLNKIKEDYMKQNSDFYSLSEARDIAEYQQQLTEEKYDYYKKRLPQRTSKIVEDLDKMMDNANRDFDGAKYQYTEAEKGLDVQLNSLYTGINTLQETIRTLQKNVEDTKTTVEQNKLKYELGLIARINLENSESALKDLENTLNNTIVNLSKQYLALTQYSYEPEK